MVSGVKLVRDTWRYQLCSIAIGRLRVPAASAAHVCVWRLGSCVSPESETEALGVGSISL